MPLGEGGPHKRVDERGAPLLRRRYSTVIGLCNMKMVADRHRCAAYHNKHWRWASYECQHRWLWM